MLTTPTPLICEIFCAMRDVDQILDFGERHGFRGDAEDQHRRVGRIDLGVNRRRRQILRQQILRRADRRLHFLLGHIDGQRQVELQGDDRGAGGTGRGHLAQARHLSELLFQRRGDGRGDHLGACSGVEGLHLDGRIGDFGQRR